MLLDVDGFAVLRTIGTNHAAFPAIAGDAAKAARALVLKQITHKSTGVQAVRSIRAALGEDVFTLIVDGMSNAQIKSLATRLDKHGMTDKGGHGAARLHILALAAGTAQATGQPQPRTPKAARTKKPAPPAPLARIHYQSAGAVRHKG